MTAVMIGRREMTKNEAIKYAKENILAYTSEMAEFKVLAVEALEKQIPKKPKEYEDKFYACPICRNVLLHKWKKYNTELMDKSNGLPYCLNCGQKLDWSDKE